MLPNITTQPQVEFSLGLSLVKYMYFTKLLIPDPIVDALSLFEMFQRDEPSAIHYPQLDLGSVLVHNTKTARKRCDVLQPEVVPRVSQF